MQRKETDFAADFADGRRSRRGSHEFREQTRIKSQNMTRVHGIDGGKFSLGQLPIANCCLT
jgi:hypothetical protein